MCGRKLFETQHKQPKDVLVMLLNMALADTTFAHSCMTLLLLCHLPYLCSDMVSRSAMFCAIATIIDQCKTEGAVDVFQTVKSLRIQKPGAVPTLVRQIFYFSICTIIRKPYMHIYFWA